MNTKLLVLSLSTLVFLTACAGGPDATEGASATSQSSGLSSSSETPSMQTTQSIEPTGETSTFAGVQRKVYIGVPNENTISFRNASGKVDASIFEGAGGNLNLTVGTGGYIKFLGTSGFGAMDSRGTWTVTSVMQNSDRRLKMDIKPMRDVLARLASVDAYTYEWKDETRRQSDGSQIGVIAQDLQKVFPQLVKESENMDAKSPLKKVLSVDYGHMSAVLLAGIKELARENAELRKRLEAVERAGRLHTAGN